MVMWKAKGRHDWGLMLAAVEINTNLRPTFSKTRKNVKLSQHNPFLDKPARATRGIPLKGDLGEAALDSCSVEESGGK